MTHRQYLKIILAMLLLPLTQVAAGLMMALGMQVPMTVTLLVCNVMAAVLLVPLGMVEWKRTFDAGRVEWASAPRIILGALLLAFSLNILSEMADLEDTLGEHIVELLTDPVGILTIGLVGPIVEEIIFREAIIGYSIGKGMKPLHAVMMSALLFGIIHINPAQIPFAFAMGMLFGLVYLRSRSIVLAGIIHIINNSIAAIQVYVLGDSALEMSLVDMFGGTVPAVIIAVAGIALSWKLTLKKLYEETLH